MMFQSLCCLNSLICRKTFSFTKISFAQGHYKPHCNMLMTYFLPFNWFKLGSHSFCNIKQYFVLQSASSGGVFK